MQQADSIRRFLPLIVVVGIGTVDRSSSVKREGPAVAAPPPNPSVSAGGEGVAKKIIISVVASVVAAAIITGAIKARSFYEQSQPITVTIQAPVSGTELTNNAFGVAGYTKGPKPSVKHSTLWLVIGSAGDLYPFGALTIGNDGFWEIPSGRICTGYGAQSIQIYQVPDADTGTLKAYVYDGTTDHPAALPGPMPKTAELAARVDVTVKNEIRC